MHDIPPGSNRTVMCCTNSFLLDGTNKKEIMNMVKKIADKKIKGVDGHGYDVCEVNNGFCY